MINIDVSEMGNIIKKAYNIPNLNLMFVGDTGIGKTEYIRRYADENGFYLETLILSQLEATESLGIPVRSVRKFNGVEYETLKTAIPEWVFNLAEHEKAILFLDEILCAEPSIFNSFLNFITTKNINGIDLSHVQIVAATNVANYTFEPDKNVLSRFCMFYVENKTFKKYLSNKYGPIASSFNYQDEDFNNIKDNVIFEERTLKPRCMETLCLIDSVDIAIFYNGFTNKKYIPVRRFHYDNEIDTILQGFVDEDFNIIDLKGLCTLLVKSFPRVRNWEKVFDPYNLTGKLSRSTIKMILDEINK